MKLSLFNGGLNIRQALELIKSNEAIVCHNASLSSGQLKSAAAPSSTPAALLSKAFYFLTEKLWMPKADERDYLEYQGRLYWTSGEGAKKFASGVLSKLGIIKPAVTPTVALHTLDVPPSITAALNGVGILTGNYVYMYTYKDSVNNVESLPSPISTSLAATLNQIDIQVTKSISIATTHINIYRKGNTLTEFTRVATLPNATVTHTDNIADSAAAGTPIIALRGVLQYVYTYYNIVDGTESAPSLPSTEITADNGRVTVTVTASPDIQTSHIRLYRIGNTLTTFTRVAELSNADTAYIDTALDSSLANEILTSELNGPAPVGLKYLTYNGGTFFGVIGTKLYFTKDGGNPNYWPETNYIDFRTELTGIGVVPNGVLLFSRYDTWVVTGSNAFTFIKYPLSGDQGCISHKTIAKLGNAILFMSTDGICTATSTEVKVLSKFKLGKQSYDPINAVVYDEEYLCQLADNSIISFDSRYEPVFETYDFNTSWLVIAQDRLYGEVEGKLLEMFKGSLVPYSYTTGNLTEGAVSELKSYDDIYIYVEGTHTLTVYINDIKVASKVIIGSAKPQHLAIPQTLQLGSSIRFELTGTGTVKEIEYTAERRENG